MPTQGAPAMVKHVLTVLADEAEHTLLRVIGERLDWPPARARQQVAAGSVYVDGRRQHDASQRLRPAQKIVVFAAADATSGPSEEASALAFIDDELAVLVKRAGVPALATRRGGEPSVADEVAARWGAAARLMHRLDREVSGLLLVSRRQATRAALAEQVRAHTLERRYLGLVVGRPTWRERVVDLPLIFVRGQAQIAHGSGARPAQTRLLWLGQRGDHALLEIALRTGRPHQIRAHLAAVGLPLLGDTRYGGEEAARVALHAHALGLRHPVSGAWIELHSPLPRALRVLWDLRQATPPPLGDATR